MSLIHRIIDPPLFSLVDLDKNQLSFYIDIFIFVSSTFSKIYKVKFLKAIGLKIRLVCTKLDLMHGSLLVTVAHHRFFKFPCIHTDLVFLYLGEACFFHFF